MKRRPSLPPSGERRGEASDPRVIDQVREEISKEQRDSVVYFLRSFVGLTGVPAAMPVGLDPLYHVLDAWVGDKLEAIIASGESVDKFLERRSMYHREPSPTAHDALLHQRAAGQETLGWFDGSYAS